MWWCTFASVCLSLFASMAFAWTPLEPETLNFRVSWGPLNVGKATFRYLPPPAPHKPYTITVTARDTSALMEMDNRWEATGIHPHARKGTFFASRSYHALQKENDYRADKIVTFNTTSKTIVYTNNRDASDVAPPVPWDGNMRDVLSALYDMRTLSANDLATGGTLRVMGPKRPFNLIRSAAISETLILQGIPTAVWRVSLKTQDINGKFGKGAWIVKLQQNANMLTPVQIIAQTAFGTFTATRKN